ncbi:hypothetical protein [Sphingomonas sp.]|uniref:hypothetical protein n=1 Tax=Sphingomonas sp. TaxID=28214 RepID=UPI003BAA99E6
MAQISAGTAAKMWVTFRDALKALGWRPSMRSRCSHPVRLSLRSGKHCYFDTLVPNPQFLEMLMGWPTGWTAPGARVTGYAAWLQRSRGQFSRLLTSWTPE